MIKKASIIALSFSILVSGAAFAGNNEIGTGNTTEESTLELQYNFLEDDFEAYTFEDEKEFLDELNLDAEALSALEKLFNEAISFEVAGNFEEAEKKWDAFEKLLDENLPEDDFEAYTFEEEKEFLDELDLDAEALSALEKLFNEAIAFEEADNFEEAEKKWDAFDKLLDANLPEDDFEEYTFEEEKEFLDELDLDAATISALEKLFNEAIALEEAGNDAEAEKVWETFDNLLESNLPEDFEEDYTFEDEKEFLEELGLDSAVMAELEELFNKAIALEEAGNDTEAEKVWETIDNLLESNLPEDSGLECNEEYYDEDNVE